jgi:DNA-binding transcriptional regulator YhcF (GntR family)
MKIFIDSNSKDLLTDQIVNAIKDQIDKKTIRAGMRLPSIRKFALAHRISRFTVVQAYDRLVAMAYLNSRRGSGFYVASRHRTSSSRQSVYKLDRAIDVLWLLRNSLQGKSSSAMPGDGWLPGSWLDEAGIKRSLRTLSGRTGEFLTAYGTPEGYCHSGKFCSTGWRKSVSGQRRHRLSSRKVRRMRWISWRGILSVRGTAYWSMTPATLFSLVRLSRWGQTLLEFPGVWKDPTPQ